MTRLFRALCATLLLALAIPAPAIAQQVAAHAIPIGKGAGVVGFGAVAPAANTKFLVGGGTSADPVMATMSGDCTLVAGAVTCTKTGGVSFATSATTDATNASNISTGTLPNARLDAEVQCIAGLASAADKVAYYTGSGTCALADFPSAMRTLLTTSSSANLRAFLSDESGTGLAYFQGGDLGTPSAGVGTNLTGTASGLTAGAATVLATARNIDGQSFNGSADITVIAPGTHAATSKATPVDADEIPLVDSAASNVLKKLTWANLKATTKTYFDTLYQPLASALTSWASVTRASGFDTFTATPSSANMRALLSDEVGTGAAYFVGGALGTPASGTATNLTGTASGLTAGNVTTNANLTGVITSVGNATSIASQTGTGTKFVIDTSPALQGTPDIQQALKISGDITPTQISSNTNDYAPTGFSTASVLRLSTDASRNVTGLAGGAAGRVIIIHNVGSNPLVLTNQDASSTAANRFLFGGDMTLAADTSVTIKYDGTSSRWRAITSPGSGGGGGGVTSVTIAAGTGVQTSGTCTITTSGTCTLALADQYRQNELLGCADASKLMVAYVRRIETFCDGYKASDGVNSGSSSNYSVTTGSGYVGPSVTGGVPSYANSGGTGDRSASITVTKSGWTSGSAGTLSNLVDGGFGTNDTDSYYFDTQTPSAGAYLRFDFGSAKLITEVTWYQSTSAGNGTWKWQGSNTAGGASGYVDIGSSFALGGTATQVQTSLSGNTTAYRYYQLLYVSGTTSATPYLEEIEFKIDVAASTNNMTLVTTAQTADATVSFGRVLMEIDPVVAITLNTDLTAEVTCDGGSHWASATLSSIGKGQSGRTVVETADTTCGANTGTSFAARAKTLNNKTVNIYKTTIVVH